MLKTSSKILDKIIENQKLLYGGAISPNWNIEKQVKDNYNEEKSLVNWRNIKNNLLVDKKMKILDLGCGYGFFVTTLRKMGFSCFGCDVDQKSVKIAKELLKLNAIDQKIISISDDFKLPYKDKTFDLINLNYVLVYVKNHKKLFSEIYRILKKNGQVYLITPNYQCCYDVNYGVFLIPWLPKVINKIYLRLLGRKNLFFFETLNFTTKKGLEKVFNNTGFSFRNTGLLDWKNQLVFPDFNGRSDLYKKIINFIKKFNMVKILTLLADFGFYTPLIYILQKK